jgi:hypothetical protein
VLQNQQLKIKYYFCGLVNHNIVRMIVVDRSLVSEDIRDIRFCCSLEHCKGMCCVEGDGGAPLLEEEIRVIEENFSAIKPYIPAQHLDIIEKEGFYYKDSDEDLCTNLVANKQCVFVFFEKDISEGHLVAKCAIEKAFEQGLIPFQKPISCHLYPIRVTDYEDFTAVNFHYWQDVCHKALTESGQPLYQLLKTPLIRRFGEDWYEELVAQCEN